MGRCIIFCAGEYAGQACPIGDDDYIIAADGGLTHLQKEHITPHEILGDFDSLGYTPENGRVFPVEKDDTDSMLAVRRGLALGYREFLLYGATGGSRLDHTVANLQTLQFLADHDAVGYLVGNDQLVTVLRNSALSFSKTNAGHFSVFCMGADARGVTIRGGHYSLENGTLTAGFPLGVSNQFTGRAVRIEVTDGSVLLIWDRTAGFPNR